MSALNMSGPDMNAPGMSGPDMSEPDMGGRGFAETLASHGLTLRKDHAECLQVNVGRLCNLACRHCHLEAGPERTEVMDRATMDEVIALVVEYKKKVYSERKCVNPLEGFESK